jgi:hypothetical protein
VGSSAPWAAAVLGLGAPEVLARDAAARYRAGFFAGAGAGPDPAAGVAGPAGEAAGSAPEATGSAGETASTLVWPAAARGCRGREVVARVLLARGREAFLAGAGADSAAGADSGSGSGVAAGAGVEAGSGVAGSGVAARSGVGAVGAGGEASVTWPDAAVPSGLGAVERGCRVRGVPARDALVRDALVRGRGVFFAGVVPGATSVSGAGPASGPGPASAGGGGPAASCWLDLARGCRGRAVATRGRAAFLAGAFAGDLAGAGAEPAGSGGGVVSSVTWPASLRD